MSYEKQTWNDGDVISAEKLNHIENGIVEANDKNTSTNILIVTITIGGQGSFSCDKTYEEILNAINNGDIVIGRCSNYGCLQVNKQMNGGTQQFEILFYFGSIVKTNVTNILIQKFVIKSDNTITYENMGYVGE